MFLRKSRLLDLYFPITCLGMILASIEDTSHIKLSEICARMENAGDTTENIGTCGCVIY
jgi:hypothetical protein